MAGLMRAVLVSAGGCCQPGTLPRPEPAAHEVRIRVRASAVNRADLLQKAGLYPPPPGASPVLGLECAGHIDAVGAAVSTWTAGAPVCALLAGGGYAEYVCVDARHVLPVPAGLSLEQAAALPEAFATAWLNLYQEAALQPGESVFIPAAASGVGSAAIQLCALRDSPCVVSVGSPAKLQACLALGAQAGLVRGEGELGALLPAGVDVILDAVAGTELATHLRLLKTGGRLVLIGLMAGREARLDLGRLLVKGLQLKGSTLRSRTADEKAALLASLQRELWPAFADGRLRPVLDSLWPWAEVEAAHAHMAANRNIGKLVLVLD